MSKITIPLVGPFVAIAKPVGKKINLKRKPVVVKKPGKGKPVKGKGKPMKGKSAKGKPGKHPATGIKGGKLFKGKKLLKGNGKPVKGKPSKGKLGKKSLPASARKHSKPTPDTEGSEGKEWWVKKGIEAKKSYLQQHPNSKMAGSVKAELQTKMEEGTLTDEDKELMDAAGVESAPDLGAQDSDQAAEKAEKTLETVETHTPSPKEKGIFKNLIRFGKEAIFKRINDPTSVFHTLSKIKHGEDFSDQDRDNVKSAFLGIGKAVLITGAIAGVAFLATSLLPDVIDDYLADKDFFGGGEAEYTGADDGYAESTAAAKAEEFKVVSGYVDDFAGWLADKDLSKYSKKS